MAKEKKVESNLLAITSITILWEKILMPPLTDTIDSKRAQEIMEAVLGRIEDTQAKIIILDMLGVGPVDSAVANHLIKITRATQLMGCTCIITGISPAISQILVHLGVELRDVVTRSTLKPDFDRSGLNSFPKS